MRIGLLPYKTEHRGEMEDWDTEEIEDILHLCRQQTLQLYCD